VMRMLREHDSIVRAALDASMLSRGCWRACCRGHGRGIA
jgi:hypothetical protein